MTCSPPWLVAALGAGVLLGRILGGAGRKFPCSPGFDCKYTQERLTCPCQAQQDIRHETWQKPPPTLTLTFKRTSAAPGLMGVLPCSRAAVLNFVMMHRFTGTGLSSKMIALYCQHQSRALPRHSVISSSLSLPPAQPPCPAVIRRAAEVKGVILGKALRNCSSNLPFYNESHLICMLI